MKKLALVLAALFAFSVVALADDTAAPAAAGNEAPAKVEKKEMKKSKKAHKHAMKKKAHKHAKKKAAETAPNQ